MVLKKIPKKTLTNKIRPLLVMVLVAGFIAAHAGSVTAAGSLTIAPAYSRVSISKAQPVQDLAISLSNNYDRTATFTARVSAVDQSGGRLVPVETGEAAIVSAIQLDQTEIELPAGKSINLGVRISDSDALSPGGHYAAIIISQKQEPGEQVPLEPAVSVALFIVKEDGAVREVDAFLPRIPSVLLHLPTSADITFTTSGNVDVVPHASVTIVRTVSTNIFAQGVVNETATPLYPGKELRLRSTFTNVQTARWPGKYAMLIRYRYAGQTEATEKAVWFWYVPMWFIIASVGAVIAGAMLLVILMRHGKRRRKNGKKSFIRMCIEKLVVRKKQPKLTQPAQPRHIVDVYAPPPTEKPSKHR